MNNSKMLMPKNCWILPLVRETPQVETQPPPKPGDSKIEEILLLKPYIEE